MSRWSRWAVTAVVVAAAVLAALGWISLRQWERSAQLVVREQARDMAAMPEFVGVAMATQVKAMHSALVSGWKARGRQRRLIEAAIAHAIDFRSWQSLSDAGLAPAEAAMLMTRMVLASC